MIVRGVAGLALPVDGDLVAKAGLDVPVHAVVRDVELAADEPLRERRVPVQRLLPRLGPAQPAGLQLPERDPVGPGLVVLVSVGVRGASSGGGANRRVSVNRFDRVLSLTRSSSALRHDSLTFSEGIRINLTSELQVRQGGAERG